jgi:hypothetical protein
MRKGPNELEPLIRCVFCWEEVPPTDEHVISNPIRTKLVGFPADAGLTWEDGSPELWAGRTDARTLDSLVVKAVCEECNNRWMQELDHQLAGVITHWAKRGDIRLGSQ